MFPLCLGKVRDSCRAVGPRRERQREEETERGRDRERESERERERDALREAYGRVTRQENPLIKKVLKRSSLSLQRSSQRRRGVEEERRIG